MDAIKLLKQQHKQVKSLFEQLEQVEDHEEKGALFEDLADNLAAHATIEENLFYPAAYGQPTKKLLGEAVEEHLAMKRIVADLLVLEPDDESFDAKLTVLKEQVEHHVEEEEDELFKEVPNVLSSDQLQTLGEQMEELFKDELEGDPTEKIPEQTAEAAKIHSPRAQARE